MNGDALALFFMGINREGPKYLLTYDQFDRLLAATRDQYENKKSANDFYSRHVSLCVFCCEIELLGVPICILYSLIQNRAHNEKDLTINATLNLVGFFDKSFVGVFFNQTNYFQLPYRMKTLINIPCSYCHQEISIGTDVFAFCLKPSC
jgi:hypothetical protein